MSITWVLLHTSLSVSWKNHREAGHMHGWEKRTPKSQSSLLGLSTDFRVDNFLLILLWLDHLTWDFLS